MTEKTFNITGMSCAACSAAIERKVNGLNGIKQAQVNLLLNRMQVVYDENVLSVSDIIAAVESVGYGASEAGVVAPVKKKEEREDRRLLRRFIASICFLVPLMYFSMGHMLHFPLPDFLSPHGNPANFALIQLILTTPVLIINRKFFISGIKAIFKGAPNMDTLVALGSAASYIYSVVLMFLINASSEGAKYAMSLFFESAAMILTLVTLGKFLESLSKGKTKDAIEKLMKLSPETAVVERDGKEVSIPAAEVRAGDIVIVRPGEYIPVDGEVIQGSTTVNQSAVTGESMPVEISEGDSIISASINISGYIKIRASKVGQDTTIAKIIKLVEDAGGSKAPIAKLADKVAAVFVPIVTAIAVITFIVWMIINRDVGNALNMAISVLVISCPCALGLATPVAIMAATGKGASLGILFRNAEVLERLRLVKNVLLDKTATITEGKPRVVKVDAVRGDERETVAIAAALESGSSHPLAEAILAYSDSVGAVKRDGNNCVYVNGKGITGEVDGKNYYLGNERLMTEHGVSASDDTAATVVYLADDEGLVGKLFIRDAVKSGSKQAVRRLRERGLKVAMLTGDNEKTARAVAAEVGISEVYSNVLPEDKLEAVKSCRKSGETAMVGDGINDAPALKEADVGITMGAGLDIAIESSDVILVHNDLNDIDTAIALSKKTITNVKENLFWAFFYNCVGIPVAAGVLYPLGITLNPMIAAAAMSLSSVFVVLNALRMRFFKNKKEKKNTMKKTVKIEGMSCMHCVKHVEEALTALNLEVTVNLKKGIAEVTGEADDAAIIAAVERAGYKVKSIS